MMNSKSYAFALLGVAMSGQVFAQEGVTTKITEIYTDPTLFGGCGAYLETALGTAACSENPRYVSFDCLNTSGQYPSSVSNRLLSQAQLGMVTQNDTFVRIEGALVLDGVCVASRVNVLAPNRTQ